MFYATDINQDALHKAEAGVFDRQDSPVHGEHRKSGGRSSLSDYYRAAYRRAAFDKSLRATLFPSTSLRCPSGLTGMRRGWPRSSATC